MPTLTRYVIFLVIVTSCNNIPRSTYWINGGYPYKKPNSHSDSNNYIFPVSGIPFDSVGYDNSRQFMQAFDERNISLSGSEKPIIRLILDINSKKPTIICIEGSQMNVKQYKSGSYFPSLDFDSLTREEQRDFNILEHNLGLKRKRLVDPYKKSRDSFTLLHPRLLSREYYNELVRKATIKEEFEYSKQVIPFSEENYSVLFDKVYHSGFWQLAPFDTTVCYDSYHNGGYYLEINTQERYSFVQQTYGCAKRGDFSALCMFIVSLARLEKEFKL